MSNHKEFEEYCIKIGINPKFSVWKPELNRYTALTTKQLLWETWNAARGITYVYNSGYK